MKLTEFIDVARGQRKADILFINGNFIDVFNCQVYEGSLAIKDDKIIGFGEYEAEEVIDLDGQYLCPGFIDGHLHLESSMLLPGEFARAVVPAGTTAVVADPHEIANVMGVEGIRFLLEASKNIPLDIFYMLPSCVPATALETSGAVLRAKDLKELFDKEKVLGLGEMMNFPGVVFKDPEVLKKLEEARGYPIDGHAPGVNGKNLNAYVGAGISSDHECTNVDEAREKLRAGMYLMIREGSTAKNLADLLPLINGANSRRCLLVTDDRHPEDLVEEGHINFLIKKSISLGLDPIIAIQMVTINPSERFNLKKRGALAPGYIADLVVFDNFNDFNINQVWKNGKIVAEKGKIKSKDNTAKINFKNSINLDLDAINLKVKNSGGKIRVIEVLPGQILTGQIITEPLVDGELAVADTERDILKISVIERHHNTGNYAVGFVKGFGLKQGAIASSVAHDSHNIITVGTNDEDMLVCINELTRVGGGLIAVEKGKILEVLPLPVAGLLTDLPLEAVKNKINNLHEKYKSLGGNMDNPFMALAFLALPVIPELKITDKGLVDLNLFDFVPLFIK